MKTIIIGARSNLSIQLSKTIPDSLLISSRDIIEGLDIFSKMKNEKFNIIFNNFQPAAQLSNIEFPQLYVENSIYTTSIILQKIKIQNINKIIYTSSSSVYGNNIFCKENDELKPMSLHASLKASNEKLIEQFCKTYLIDYTITRIFNMYGEDDNFSIVSKIIKAYKNNNVLNIINQGAAIRDFIHINDVVISYQKLLKLKTLPILNIGTGDGVSIKNILDFLKINQIYIQTQNIFRDEIKMSTSDNTLLVKELQQDKFISIFDYILKEVR